MGTHAKTRKCSTVDVAGAAFLVVARRRRRRIKEGMFLVRTQPLRWPSSTADRKRCDFLSRWQFARALIVPD
jgi:hypothetical protein